MLPELWRREGQTNKLSNLICPATLVLGLGSIFWTQKRRVDGLGMFLGKIFFRIVDKSIRMSACLSVCPEKLAKTRDWKSRLKIKFGEDVPL